MTTIITNYDAFIHHDDVITIMVGNGYQHNGDNININVNNFKPDIRAKPAGPNDGLAA